MGVYDDKLSFGFDSQKMKPLLMIGAAIIALILIVFLGAFVVEWFSAPAIQINLDPTLDLSKEPSALMYLTLTNTTGATAEDVRVKVEPVDSESIIVFPEEKAVSLVGAGENRKLDFVIRPNPATTVLTGNYTLKATALVNGKKFEEEVTLKVLKE